MEQSASGPTDYRLALHSNRMGRTLVNGKKVGREGGTVDGARREFMLPLMATDQYVLLRFVSNRFPLKILLLPSGIFIFD